MFKHTSFSLDNITIGVNCLCTDKEYLKNKIPQDYTLSDGKIITYRNGKIGNLSINENITNNFTTIQGSITAYFNGNNFQSIPLNGVEQAYIELGKDLGISEEAIREATFKVGRKKNGGSYGFEYGLSIEVSQPVKDYLSSMVEMRGQNEHKGYGSTGDKPNITKYFVNKSYEFYGYDKGRQLQDKLCPIPQEWQGKEILRLEKRLLKGTALKALTGKQLHLSDICTPQFKHALIDDFMKTFNNIIFDNNCKNLDKAKNHEEVNALINPNQYLFSLSISKEMGKISEASYNRKHAWITKQLKENKGTLKIELDQKFQEIQSHFEDSL